MNDGKAGVSIEKKILRQHIFSKIMGVGHLKMINSELAACFAVAGVQICLLDTNKISSPHIWEYLFDPPLNLGPTYYKRRQSRQPYRKKQSLKYHI